MLLDLMQNVIKIVLLIAVFILLVISVPSYAADVLPPIANRDDPFKKKVKIKPDPQENSASSVEQFPLSALRLVGILQENNVSWAVLLDPLGRLHKYKTGDTIGLERANIIAIVAEKIILRVMADGQVRTQTLNLS